MKNKNIPQIQNDFTKQLMKTMEEINKQVNQERKERNEEKNNFIK